MVQRRVTEANDGRAQTAEDEYDLQAVVRFVGVCGRQVRETHILGSDRLPGPMSWWHSQHSPRKIIDMRVCTGNHGQVMNNLSGC